MAGIVQYWADDTTYFWIIKYEFGRINQTDPRHTDAVADVAREAKVGFVLK